MAVWDASSWEFGKRGEAGLPWLELVGNKVEGISAKKKNPFTCLSVFLSLEREKMLVVFPTKKQGKATEPRVGAQGEPDTGGCQVLGSFFIPRPMPAPPTAEPSAPSASHPLHQCNAASPSACGSKEQIQMTPYFGTRTSSRLPLLFPGAEEHHFPGEEAPCHPRCLFSRVCFAIGRRPRSPIAAGRHQEV